MKCEFFRTPVHYAEIGRRLKDDKDFRSAFYEDAQLVFNAELAVCNINKGNLLIFIYGHRNIGKSETAQSIGLMIKGILKHYEINATLAFTRNYSQTNKMLADATKDGDIFIIIQDEDESLTGENKEIERRNFINNLKQGRVLRNSIIICDVELDKNIIGKMNFALEGIGQDFNNRINQLLMYDSGGYPIGQVLIPLHNDEVLRSNYKEWKLTNQVEITAQGGGRGVKSDLDDKITKVFESTHTGGVLTKRDFQRKVRELYPYLGIMDKELIAGSAYDRWKREVKPTLEVPRSRESSAQANPNTSTPERLKAIKGSVGYIDGHSAEDDFRDTESKKYYSNYHQLGGKGEPDGESSQSDAYYVICIKTTIGHRNSYSCSFHDYRPEFYYAVRLEAAGVKNIHLMIHVKNRITGVWLPPKEPNWRLQKAVTWDGKELNLEVVQTENAG